MTFSGVCEKRSPRPPSREKGGRLGAGGGQGVGERGEGKR